MGDKGYIGNGMLPPIRKPVPETPQLGESLQQTGHQIRYLIERAIANLKTWRILHIDYRRPHPTFTTTISAVIAPTILQDQP